MIAADTATGSAYVAPNFPGVPAAIALTPSAANAMSPVILSADASFRAGIAGSSTIGRSALPAATFSEVGTLPAGVTLSQDGVLSGTPATGTGGAYPITVTASNGVPPNFSQAFTLAVYEAPTVAVQPTATFRVGTTVSIPVQVTGFPAPTVVGSVLPAGVSLSQPTPGTWQLSGTPAVGSGGQYQASFTARNPVGGSTAAMAIAVQEAPAIGAASASFTTGTSSSVSLASRGFPAPDYSETGKLPIGVTLSPAGVLSGTPAAGTAGRYPIQLTATNILGSATQAFTVFVEAPPAIAVGALATTGVPWAQSPQLGAGWHSLGGTVSAVPAVAAAPNPDGASPVKPVFIAPGTNHVLYIRGVTGAWQRIGPQDPSCLSAAATITVSGTVRTLNVACEGPNNALYYGSATVPASGLPVFSTAWKNLGGTLSAGPALAPVGGTLTFFVLGTNGKILIRTVTTGYQQQTWTCLGQPAAAWQAVTGNTFFACQGANHGLYEGTVTKAGLGEAKRFAGTLAAGPAIATTSRGPVLLLVGTNHLVYQGNLGGVNTTLRPLIATGVEAAALN